jgi:hypothetical protein
MIVVQKWLRKKIHKDLEHLFLNDRKNVKTKYQYLPYHHSEHTNGVYPQSANVKTNF